MLVKGAPGYRNGYAHTWPFDLLKWLMTTHKPVLWLYYNSHMWCEKNAICNVRDYRYTTKCTGIWHFDTKISHNCKDIHHYIVVLWEFSVFNNSLRGSRDICDWSPDYNLSVIMVERCHSSCSILSFGILSKICFLCINHIYWNQKKPGPKP